MRLRGRKGIRESLLEQPELIILNPLQYRGKWADKFGNNDPIHVELGMGKGQFISAMSAKHSEVNFIGVDRYDELVRRAGEKARAILNDKGGVPPQNLLLALFDIGRIEEVFAEREISHIYLNFSDPWPKSRHIRRRLTHPQFLRKYQRVLQYDGEIELKTDSLELFEFSLSSFASCGWYIDQVSRDLHKAGIAPQEILTEYETKFVEQGLPIYYCRAISEIP